MFPAPGTTLKQLELNVSSIVILQYRYICAISDEKNQFGVFSQSANIIHLAQYLSYCLYVTQLF